jgi:hypothetical protein
MESTETVETAIGDLIVALTRAAFRFARNEREASILVAYMLSGRFHSSGPISQSWH